MLQARLSIALVMFTFACGGAIDPAPDAEAEADAQAEAAPKPEHFVCEVPTTSAVHYVECLTLPDGGPSYTDTSASTDCRTYELGAGQGCAPPMSCQAAIDGELLPGTCVPAP